MEKCVLFGAGKIASKIHEKYKEEIVAVIDNDPSKIGLYIWDDIPIISLKDYKDDYSFLPIMITTVYCKNIEKQLRDNNITNFSFQMSCGEVEMLKLAIIFLIQDGRPI